MLFCLKDRDLHLTFADEAETSPDIITGGIAGAKTIKPLAFFNDYFKNNYQQRRT